MENLPPFVAFGSTDQTHLSLTNGRRGSAEGPCAQVKATMKTTIAVTFDHKSGRGNPMNLKKLGRRCAAALGALLLNACGGGSEGLDQPLPTHEAKTVATAPASASAAFNKPVEVVKELSPERVQTMDGRWLPAINKPFAVPSTMPPIPATTWTPPEGSTPESGNYLYLVSDHQSRLGSDLQDGLTVLAEGPDLSISLGGSPAWEGRFKALRGQKRWSTGYYDQLIHHPNSTPSNGSLDWRTSTQGCDSASAWLAIDQVSYVEDKLIAIELRFEQRCTGSYWPIQGKLSWRADNSPGPAYPAPTTLWQAESDATPASGNYVYLKSDAGDFIGQGRTLTYTQKDAVLDVSESGGRVSVRVNGDAWWNGDFKAMDGVSRLRPGYYATLQRHPFHDTRHGGLSWSGDGRGCNTLYGWFVVDSISYGIHGLKAIDLRFEQHCEGWSSALRGEVHWRDDDTSGPAGPQLPIPAGLWKPAPGATPANGPFIYLESDAGDYVGQGRSLVYTPNNANLRFSSQQAGIQVDVHATDPSTWWTGSFQPMNTVERLQPGYYGDISRAPFKNPTRGGLDWWGDGRGCNKLTGWFAVDSIAYSGDLLTGVSLRFEQHCEGAAPALKGQIHWTLE